VAFIDLDRRFLRWSEKDSDAAEVYALLRHYARNGLDWPRLLQHRRVVVLAEAGSGKSEELKAQARHVIANGQFGFYATVQDVARQGLERALGDAGRARLQQWRASDQPGWFLIDSIDEAKLDKISWKLRFYSSRMASTRRRGTIAPHKSFRPGSLRGIARHFVSFATPGESRSRWPHPPSSAAIEYTRPAGCLLRKG
jgi:hypothetical protein